MIVNPMSVLISCMVVLFFVHQSVPSYALNMKVSATALDDNITLSLSRKHHMDDNTKKNGEENGKGFSCTVGSPYLDLLVGTMGHGYGIGGDFPGPQVEE